MIRPTVRALLPIGLLSICALAQTPSPQTLYRTSDVVFLGRLDALKDNGTLRIATFRIDHAVKGITSEKVVVETPKNSECHALEEQHSYVVYAQKHQGFLWLDPCAGTKLRTQGQEDLRFLHTVDPAISPSCDADHMRKLAKKTPIIVEAELIDTETTAAYKSADVNQLLTFHPWCGFVFSTEDAYYKVDRVLKGELNDTYFVGEHLICWDTLTVDGYNPELSSSLFVPGNKLLLFVKPATDRGVRPVPPPNKHAFLASDGDCSAVLADSAAAGFARESLR
ncbi:hypothetical protein Acid345_2534 [Candidatus Koribacter versatilis Ellin345]|uniref:Uncharacterized protein n=1 Tax=Koribacter versatilis (strain Ellin345) TaxID=204669 RepID=Q1INL5_KORVE|nr:hypothetical protein [Candidatus Koribacter versatilis]ABF41535.1 hypothetical protein Acid345_2534 [Candidatus Koribacter versatilis Ellin345]